MQPQNNPYEFLNSAAPPTATGPLGKFTGGNSIQKRLIVVGVGVVILIIVAVVVSSLISGIGKTNVQSLASVAADQSELITTSTTGSQTASNQLAKNLAATTLSSMTSSQGQYLKAVAKAGGHLSSKQTTANNASIASGLTAAVNSGTFDLTFVQDIQTELGVYNTDLLAAYKATPDNTIRTLLNNLYHQSQLIQTEANAAAQNLSST